MQFSSNTVQMHINEQQAFQDVRRTRNCKLITFSTTEGFDKQLHQPNKS